MLSFLIHTTELGSRILITFYKYNLLLGHKIEFIPAEMAGIAVKQIILREQTMENTFM